MLNIQLESIQKSREWVPKHSGWGKVGGKVGC